MDDDGEGTGRRVANFIFMVPTAVSCEIIARHIGGKHEEPDTVKVVEGSLG